MSRRSAAPCLVPLLLLPVLAGCAEPFEGSFYHLDAPRVVAITTPDDAWTPGALERATALVYRDGFWPQDDALDLAWFMPRTHTHLAVFELADVSPGGLAEDPDVLLLGTGPDLDVAVTGAVAEVLPADGEAALLGFAVTGEGPEGPVDLRAAVSLTVGQGLDTPPTLAALTRSVVPALSVGGGTETVPTEALAADTRQAAAGVPVEAFVPVGETLRLAAAPVDADGDPVEVLWFAADTGAGTGTLLPLDETRLDWVPAALQVDEADDTQLRVEALPAGLHSFAVVLSDGRGGIGWEVLDVALYDGDDPTPTALDLPVPLLWGRRLLWAEADSALSQAALLAEAGGAAVPVYAEVEASSDAPGFRLTHTRPVEAGLPQADALPCHAELLNPLPVEDVLLGRCTVADLLGATVLIEVQVQRLPGGTR